MAGTTVIASHQPHSLCRQHLPRRDSDQSPNEPSSPPNALSLVFRRPPSGFPITLTRRLHIPFTVHHVYLHATLGRTPYRAQWLSE
ncbi:hypothetical protein M3J09_012609 [Ascochyta lentis]